MLSFPLNAMKVRSRRFAALIWFAAICWMAGTGAAVAAPKQASFKSPEEAADALVAALKANDERRLVDALWTRRREAHRFRRCDRRSGRACQVRGCLRRSTQDRNAGGRESGAQRRQGRLAVPGSDREARRRSWRFDAKKGQNEIVNRRIGKNELSTIQVLLAIVDAQREYSSEDRERRRPPRVCPALFQREGQEGWPLLAEPSGRAGEPPRSAGGDGEQGGLQTGGAASRRPTTVTTTRF